MRSTIRKSLSKLTFGASDYLNFLRKKWTVQSRVRQILKRGSEIKIEIGSGDKMGENGWTTIDVTSGTDLRWDLRYGIPFPDNTISKIYSSHLFEHLKYEHIMGLLKECMRVLRPGGEFLICVPNSRHYIESYAKKDNTFWNQMPAKYGPAVHNTGTPMDYVNYMAYMDDEHKYMFDEENLQAVLKLAGMKDVSLRPMDPTLDMPSRDFESAYARGTKPR